MKKHYVAEMVKDGQVKGSIIVSVWVWQSCRKAYSGINEVAGSHGTANFRRVR